MDCDTQGNASNRRASHKCTNCYAKETCRWHLQSSHYGGKRVCENCHSYARKNGRKRPPHLQSKLGKDRFGGAAYAPECPGSHQQCSKCRDGSSSGVIWLHSMKEPRKWLCGRCGAVELQKNNASPEMVPPPRPEQTKSPTPDTANNNDSHIESDPADSDFISGRKRRLRKRKGRADASTARENGSTQPQPPYNQPGSSRIRTEKFDNDSQMRRDSNSAKPFVARSRENRSATVPTAEHIRAEQEVDTSSSTSPEVRKEYVTLLGLVVEVEVVSRVGGIPETQACIEAALVLVRGILAHHGVQPTVHLMELLVESKLNLQAGNMERMAASMKDCRSIVESHLI
ncbi:hypothetical protein Moror_7074 [Moniliophthora roreri MCA 2997]|uniref:GATA-type domain-containing protein n=1 Tax=Moniliophthora roreri (strain MCA 2997) TaxID=1381753 RepID=V2XAS8_MONRO|nr:hypothetical protein Moror_7074 [Moniliophthora roreri MCA 2997]